MLQAKLKRIALIAVLVFSICPAAAAQTNVAPSGYEVTVVAETRGRLTLQSELNTKLTEAGDTITASLIEPIYAEGRMVGAACRHAPQPIDGSRWCRVDGSPRTRPNQKIGSPALV